MLTAVWLDLDIVVELLTDVINADARFLMGDIADVRMIAGLCLVTGLAAVAESALGCFSHCRAFAKASASMRLPEPVSPLMIYAWEMFPVSMAVWKCSFACFCPMISLKFAINASYDRSGKQIEDHSLNFTDFIEYCQMVLLLAHELLGEIVQCGIDQLYHAVHSVPSFLIEKVLAAEGMGVCNDLIHKFFDHFAVQLHVADVHLAAELVALLGDILHHHSQTGAQLLFFNAAEQGKTKGTIRLSDRCFWFKLCRLLQLVYTQIHDSSSFFFAQIMRSDLYKIVTDLCPDVIGNLFLRTIAVYDNDIFYILHTVDEVKITFPDICETIQCLVDICLVTSL